MGCDIHMLYQKVDIQYLRDVKISTILDDTDINKDELQWVYILDGPVVEGYQFSGEHRNYYWFGRLSEVRGEGPRITQPFWPEGEQNNEDWEFNHSHSHIYLNELLDIEWSNDDKSRMGTFIYKDIPTMKRYCDERNLDYKHFRILISYDS